jgi:hypothetical protein
MPYCDEYAFRAVHYEDMQIKPVLLVPGARETGQYLIGYHLCRKASDIFVALSSNTTLNYPAA